MAYLSPDDFRTPLAEYCTGFDLTTTEASDATLTAAIAGLSARVDHITGDHFESESRTFELDVADSSTRLYLPRRTRSVSTVKLRAADGTLSTELTTVYRLRSSLDTTGTYRVGDFDSLDIIPDGGGLSTGLWWPQGYQTVQVVGTFSWATTPSDIKRATARLVYDRIKEQGPDLDRAETLASGGVTLRFVQTDAEHPTGIREVDEILSGYLYGGGGGGGYPTVLIA